MYRYDFNFAGPLKFKGPLFINPDMYGRCLSLPGRAKEMIKKSKHPDMLFSRFH